MEGLSVQSECSVILLHIMTDTESKLHSFLYIYELSIYIDGLYLKPEDT